MAKGSILIPYALRGDTMVHVSEVESGLHRDCLCVACGGALVARKGAKTAHHFAHHTEANCSGETARHELGACRAYRDRLPASTCPHCHAFVGDFFIHDYVYAWSPENGHDAGWACHACIDRKRQGLPPGGGSETVT